MFSIRVCTCTMYLEYQGKKMLIFYFLYFFDFRLLNSTWDLFLFFFLYFLYFFSCFLSCLSLLSLYLFLLYILFIAAIHYRYFVIKVAAPIPITKHSDATPNALLPLTPRFPFFSFPAF